MAGFPSRRPDILAGFVRGWIAVVLFVAVLSAVGCADDPAPASVTAPPPDEAPADSPTILALGDSYTVGESVPAAASWPYQLADSLAARDIDLASLEVVAQTGWTSRDLLEGLRRWREASNPPEMTFDLVTVMIGVNDQFHGVEPGRFAAAVDTLIALSLELAGGSPDRVLGFSIPDYGATPVGMMFDPDRIAADIDRFNEILQQTFADAGIVILDVTGLSRQSADEPGLVARDGLHFSPEMYRRWVEMMMPQVRLGLGRQAACAPASRRPQPHDQPVSLDPPPPPNTR